MVWILSRYIEQPNTTTMYRLPSYLLAGAIMNRVACTFSSPIAWSDDMMPHLYDRDIERLEDFVEKCDLTDDKEIQDLGLLVRRVLDWIAAESRAAQYAVKMSAHRDEDGVIVVNGDLAVIGEGPGILPALHNCVMKMDKLYSDQKGQENDFVVKWVEEFPYET
jgi:hypothetical protein